jgi:hypothetical protein
MENRTFLPNSGIVTTPDVTVADQPGLPGSLSGATAFSLVIGSDSFVRFAPESLSSVTVQGISGVLLSSVSSDLRTLRFTASTPIPSGASLTVSEIRVVVYDRYSPLRGFDLDVGSDGGIDAYDSNGIRVSQDYGKPDVTPPYDPVAVSGSFLQGSVKISAEPSGDVDFANFAISFESASGSVLKNVVATTLSSASFDLPTGTVRVRVQSVDTHSNTSSGVLLSASSSATGSVVPTASGSVSSTGSAVTVPVATGSVSVPAPYVPAYRDARLSALIRAMDAFIASKAATDAVGVANARNALAGQFEAFYRTRLAAKRQALFLQIKASVATLKALLK